MLLEYFNTHPQGNITTKSVFGNILTFVPWDIQSVSDEDGASILNNYSNYFRVVGKDVTTIFQDLDVSAWPATYTLPPTNSVESNQEIIVELIWYNQGTIQWSDWELIDWVATYVFSGNNNSVRLRRKTGSWAIISGSDSGWLDVLNIRSFA